MATISTGKFMPGTTMGEAAWLIARALNTLAPLAPAVFGRQTIGGGLELDFDRWMAAAEKLAIQIQIRAGELTPQAAQDAAFTEEV